MHRVLIGHFGDAQTLLSNAQPRDIHHDEHRSETLILLTNQIAGRAVIVHHASRIAMNAHFMFDRTTGKRVACAQRSVIIDQEFGYDEQRDALHIVRRIGCLCQHQMDDIFGQIMFTRRNEDFHAGNGM